MKEIIVNQSQPSNLNKGLRQTICLRLLGAAMLLSLTLGSYASLDYLVPKGPGGTEGVIARLSWYVESGQPRSDVRTLASVVQFLIEKDSDTGTVDTSANLPVAAKATQNLPKS